MENKRRSGCGLCRFFSCKAQHAVGGFWHPLVVLLLIALLFLALLFRRAPVARTYHAPEGGREERREGGRFVTPPNAAPHKWNQRALWWQGIDAARCCGIALGVVGRREELLPSNSYLIARRLRAP